MTKREREIVERIKEALPGPHPHAPKADEEVARIIREEIERATK